MSCFYLINTTAKSTEMIFLKLYLEIRVQFRLVKLRVVPVRLSTADPDTADVVYLSRSYTYIFYLVSYNKLIMFMNYAVVIEYLKWTYIY